MRRALVPRLACAALLGVLLGAPPARAQQPFIVDDAEVTPSGAWHVELSSQIDLLRASAKPALWQHTLECEVDYGVASRLELAAIAPVLAIVSGTAGARRAIGGIGDSALGLKFRLTRDPAARHALAVSASLELPTGSRRRGLGSALVDVGLNVVSQHRLTEALAVHLNAGTLLAGNTQAGAVGIKERGTVLTAGSALLRRIGGRALVGAEVTMAWSQKASLGGSFVGWQVGTSVALRDNLTLDVGVLGGWFDASPRGAFQVGTSIDVR